MSKRENVVAPVDIAITWERTKLRAVTVEVACEEPKELRFKPMTARIRLAQEMKRVQSVVERARTAAVQLGLEEDFNSLLLSCIEEEIECRPSGKGTFLSKGMQRIQK